MPAGAATGVSLLLRQYQLLAAALGLVHLVLALPLEAELEPVPATAVDWHGRVSVLAMVVVHSSTDRTEEKRQQVFDEDGYRLFDTCGF